MHLNIHRNTQALFLHLEGKYIKDERSLSKNQNFVLRYSMKYFLRIVFIYARNEELNFQQPQN